MIAGGRVVTPAGVVTGDVVVEGERIVAIADGDAPRARAAMESHLDEVRRAADQ